MGFNVGVVGLERLRLGQLILSNNIRLSLPALSIADTATYIRAKASTLLFGGSVRLRFEHRILGGIGNIFTNVEIRINGANIHTFTTTVHTNWVPQVFDLQNVNPFTVIELWHNRLLSHNIDMGGVSHLQNFTLSYDFLSREQDIINTHN